MKGVFLALKYGFPPCELGLCGPQDKKSKEKIIKYLINGGSGNLTEEIMEGFKGAYPYYREIAEINGLKSPLVEKAVRAYWTGNDLLKEIRLFHFWHVLTVGARKPDLVFTPPMYDKCRVSWGEVVEKMHGRAIVKYCPLVKKKEKWLLGEEMEKEFSWDKKLEENFKTGDWVSMHWNTIIEKLNKKQKNNLEFYSAFALKSYADFKKEK